MIKDIFNIKNPDIQKIIASKFLDKIADIARYNKNSQSFNRGSTFFGSDKSIFKIR